MGQNNVDVNSSGGIDAGQQASICSLRLLLNNASLFQQFVDPVGYLIG